MPSMTIPRSRIAFQPACLPPGDTQFRIVLEDYHFLGANYTGKVILSSMAATNIPPADEKLVTVGL
jgi:hypothetical protein